MTVKFLKYSSLKYQKVADLLVFFREMFRVALLISSNLNGDPQYFLNIDILSKTGALSRFPSSKKNLSLKARTDPAIRCVVGFLIDES